MQPLGQSRERAEGRLVGSAALRPAGHAEESKQRSQRVTVKDLVRPHGRRVGREEGEVD